MIEAKSKCRKVDSGRSNRKRVICLHCDKVLNQDNRKYHHESKHKGQTTSYRILSETNQTLINFAVVSNDSVQVRIEIPIFKIINLEYKFNWHKSFGILYSH